MELESKWIMLFKSLVILMGTFGTALVGNGQSSNFLYGKVTTVDGDQYIGQIRWGKEEAFWHDIFDAGKVSQRYNRYSKKNNDGSLIDFDFFNIWEDKYRQIDHSFSCSFGDLKEIEWQSDYSVILTFKNDFTLKVKKGNYNDVNTYLRVFDYEIGEFKISSQRIKRVEFRPFPNDYESKIGKPLFGKVETIKGTYTGFIEWDKDERVALDKLDGSYNNKENSFPFGKIQKIEKEREGSTVILKSGKQIFVSGTNDVNKGNRGIIVSEGNVGKIEIEWEEFISAEFLSEEDIPELSYNSYPEAEKLGGSVKMINGDLIEGFIVYDLDESWSFEHLDGYSRELKYSIPFRNIKRIIPKNYNYSRIVLRNGQEIVLGDERDVNEKNAGLLVFKNTDEEPIFVAWKEVDEIIFR